MNGAIVTKQPTQGRRYVSTNKLNVSCMENTEDDMGYLDVKTREAAEDEDLFDHLDLPPQVHPALDRLASAVEKAIAAEDAAIAALDEDIVRLKRKLRKT